MKKINSFLLSLTFAAFAFSAKAQSVTNSYGIPNAEWNTYVNKTNVLLESVDEESFVNFVVLANHGNANDLVWFKEYLKGKFKRDKEELIYRVGTGAIKSV